MNWHHGTPPSPAAGPAASSPPPAPGRRDGARPAGETPAVLCDREAEVWRAIEARHWPERCDDELRAHVASCLDCADLVEVATVLTEDHDDAVRAAHVPPSGTVWWRAQLRARQDAARVARRAINVVQAVTVAVALVAVAFVLSASGGFAWMARAVEGVHVTLPVILALASPLLLAPIAVYFVVTED
jgi:hypothetical protein